MLVKAEQEGTASLNNWFVGPCHHVTAHHRIAAGEYGL